MGLGISPFPSFTHTPISFGVSEAADLVRDHYRKSVQSLRETVTLGLGVSDSIRELAAVYSECKTSDWDGYRAIPVSESTYEFASGVLDALPLGTPAPSIGAEPDGHLTLEWYQSPHRTLSVSIGPQGDLHYAALLGASKQYGMEPFFHDQLPKPIIDLIFRVMVA